MARKTAGLTALAVRHAKPGRHADGGNLYLLVRPAPSGARSWLFRYVIAGKMREMGLGPAAGPVSISLAEARAKASKLRDVIAAGRDPLAERAAAAASAAAEAQAQVVAAKTFADVTELYLAAHEGSWRNAKHRAQWRATLEAYAFPHIRDVPVSAIGTSHIMDVLEPIWSTKPETASRVRGRIEAVVDYGIARAWRSADNPARWRGHIANLLPKRSTIAPVVHHAALPWTQIRSFMAELQVRDATAGRACEFLILTASRTGEALGARWSEIDLDAGLWTVPAARMKAHREHRVPLSTAAMAVLAIMSPMRSSTGEGWIFPGDRDGRPLSGMALLMLLRRMGRGDLTAHGFRSTFRDWVGEATTHQPEVAEAALAHTVRDKTEAAYARGDLFMKRRKLMDDWAAFCSPDPSSAAVPAAAVQS